MTKTKQQKEEQKITDLAKVITETDVEIVAEPEKMPDLLTEEEEKQFDELEKEGERVSATMLESAREFGRILSVIKENEYYKKQRKDKNIPVFTDFKDYVKWKFNRGRTMGYNYISVFNVMGALEQADLDPNSLRTVTNTVTVSDEIKKLLRLENVDQDEMDDLIKKITVKATNLILNTAPTDDKGNPILEQEHIYTVFEIMNSVVREKVVELDGEQIPVTLQQLAVEDQITWALKEQIERRRQGNFEEYHKSQDRLKEPKTIEIEPVTSEDEEGKYAHISCPLHGETTPVSLVQAGFWTFCDCLFVLKEVEAGHCEFFWIEERKDESA